MPLEKRRVVITGMGVVAPNGIGVENFWDSLVHGRSAVRRITHFDASSYPCQIAAEVPNFDPSDYMDYRIAKRLGRFAQFALAASQMAALPYCIRRFTSAARSHNQPGHFRKHGNRKRILARRN